MNYHLDEYKEILVDNFKYKLESISDYEIEKLIYDNQSLIDFNKRNNIEVDSFNQKKLDEKIISILEKNESEVLEIETKIDSSNFSFSK